MMPSTSNFLLKIVNNTIISALVILEGIGKLGILYLLLLMPWHESQESSPLNLPEIK